MSTLRSLISDERVCEQCEASSRKRSGEVHLSPQDNRMVMSEETIFLRTSERVTYTRCKQKWWWEFIERLKPISVANPLRFGDLVHQALAAFYRPGSPHKVKRGPKPHLTFKKLYQKQLEEHSEFGQKTEDEEWVNALDLGIEMLKNYVERYGLDDRYEVVAPEVSFEIDIFDEDEEYVCTYAGTFDAVVRDTQTNEIGLLEHKTAKSISTGFLTMDEQAGSYWAYAEDYLREKKVLKPKQHLDFILYNYLRKGKKDDRHQNNKGQYLNKDGSVSKQQGTPLFHREIIYRTQDNRRNTMLRVIDQAREMKMVRDGDLPVYKSIINGCSGMFGCNFRDFCEVQEAGGDWESLRDATMTKWDPYKDHEFKEEE